MNKSFKKSELFGAIFTIILGTLLHFAYGWSNQNPVVAIFAPYNESVWEHLKLLFFPVLLYSFFQYFFIGRHYTCFITGKLLGILSGMVSIVAIFYLYSGIIGHSVLWIDISLFVLSVALCFWISCHFTLHNHCTRYLEIISLFLLLGLFLCFYMFTFLPPDFILFREP